MTTHTIHTYSIQEHPNKAAVIDHVRGSWPDMYLWGVDNVDSLKAFCDHFNLSGLDYSVSLCGYSYASATVGCELEDLAGVRLWKYLNNSGLLNGGILAGNCPLTGYCFDENILDPIRKFMTNPVAGCTFQDLIDDCLQSWTSTYVADWEYAYTDEAIEDHLVCNEYEFLESGEAYFAKEKRIAQ